MASDRYLRFKVKMTVGGYSHFDGFATVDSITNVINSAMVDLNAPPFDFRILYRYTEGAHIHYDMMIGKTLVAFEIECIAEDDGTRRSTEPLPLPGPVKD
jgi:hypothetical protein